MVCVSEDNLCIDVFLKVSVIDSLYASDSAYGHEDRGRYISVVCMENSCPCIAVLIVMKDFKHTGQKYEKLYICT